MRRRVLLFSLLVLLLICGISVAVYYFPPVHNRLAWRVESLRVNILRRINPPEQQVFLPQGQADTVLPSPFARTLPAVQPVFTPTSPPPTGTPQPSPSPTPSPTPLPLQAELSGIVHEYQQFNNCGPASLAMALSYWGWQGDQRDTRLALRPNFVEVDDKNVNPWEMVRFVEATGELKAAARVGGDLNLLKRLLAAGFPTLIEAGIQPHPGDWMGHYLLISGYDDEKNRFITQDSLIGPDIPVQYSTVAEGWRSFNNAFVTLAPPEKEAELLSVLGEWADEDGSYKIAAQVAQQEINQLNGRDLFFAWYNLGSSLVAQGDYQAAAQAYDQAFALYAEIPEDDRPWRILWYQDGPLAAYYHTGRYQDVITLGNQTLDSAGGPVLEETFFWLGMAREATGSLDKAIYDYQMAVKINPNSTPAAQALQRLGAGLP